MNILTIIHWLLRNSYKIAFKLLVELPVSDCFVTVLQQDVTEATDTVDFTRTGILTNSW